MNYICIIYVLYMYIICILYVYYMILYVYYMYYICILYVLYMYQIICIRFAFAGFCWLFLGFLVFFASAAIFVCVFSGFCWLFLGSMRKLKITGVPWQIPGFPFRTWASPSDPRLPLQILGFPFSLPGFPFSFPGFPFRWWETRTGDSQN